MAIPLPNLDDKTFAQLMEEAKAIIPRYSRDWTNFNPSDPGITLLELFAWINEMIIYRQNTITRETKWELLKLLMPAPKTAFVEIEVPYVPPVDPLDEKKYLPFPNLSKVYRDVKINGIRKDIWFEHPVTDRRISPNGKECYFVRFYNIAEQPYKPDGHTGPNSKFTLKQKACSFESKNQVIPIFTTENKITKPLVYHPDLKGAKNFYVSTHKPVLYVMAPGASEGQAWHFVEHLHTQGTASNVFTFDYHRRAIVFGDGMTGNIPPANATLVLENLYLSDGADAQIEQSVVWSLVRPEGSTEALMTMNPGKIEDGEDWFVGDSVMYLDEETYCDELLEAAVKKSLDFHRPPYFRAVTKEDYIALALEAYKTTELPSGLDVEPDEVTGVQRAWTIENYKIAPVTEEPEETSEPRNTESSISNEQPNPIDDKGENLKNHLSVVLMNESIYDNFQQVSVFEPGKKQNHDVIVDKHKELINAVFAHVNRRRLITTMLHVGLPRERYFAMEIRIRLLANKMQSLSEVEYLVLTALSDYFNPITGGMDRKGRPVGQSLFKSEIYTLLEKLDFVDVVDNLTLYKEKSTSRTYYSDVSSSGDSTVPKRSCQFNTVDGTATLKAESTPEDAVSIAMQITESIPLDRDELLVFVKEAISVSITF